jgi:hypothetical protein
MKQSGLLVFIELHQGASLEFELWDDHLIDASNPRGGTDE